MATDDTTNRNKIVCLIPIPIVSSIGGCGYKPFDSLVDFSRCPFCKVIYKYKHRHICSRHAARTIYITEEAYNRLKSQKVENQSFSKVIIKNSEAKGNFLRSWMRLSKTTHRRTVLDSPEESRRSRMLDQPKLTHRLKAHSYTSPFSPSNPSAPADAFRWPILSSTPAARTPPPLARGPTRDRISLE